MSKIRLNNLIRRGATLLLLLMPAAAQGQEIRLRTTARVNSATVRIVDVANLSGADAATLAAVGGIELSLQKWETADALVDVADVRRALIAVDWNLANVRFVGATRCVVRRPATAVAVVAEAAADEPAASEAPAASAVSAKEPQDRPATVEEAVRAFLRERLAGTGEEVSVRFAAASREALALGGPEARIAVESRGPVAPGYVSLEATLTQPGTARRRVSVVAEVSVVRSVVVARQPINQGRIIRPGDVALEPREVSRDATGLSDLSAAVGQEAKVFIRVGQPVRAGDVRPAPLVRRGDLVTVRARRGGVAIQTVGRASSSGAAGDVITLKNASSGELFEARVSGPRTAELDTRVGEQVAAR